MGLIEESNLCGATLLQLTATGSAIIAELLRLAAKVPTVFTDASEFSAVVFDFKYLRAPEDFENRVNTTNGLLDVDQEFLQVHGAFARRAYNLFESMVKYWRDVANFLDRLDSGYFIRHTLDNVLEDVDGKQLVCEAYYLFGSMLVLMDARLPGPTREKLVIACYRDGGDSQLELVDEVCRLVRSTQGSKKPAVETLFQRVMSPTTTHAARAVIAALASDDVYLMSTAFPDPAMRSTRLAAQASMLYVILWFDPETLKSNQSAMRQVVDRHFCDNWVIPVYMGHVVDLSVDWQGYKAASLALDNVLTDKDVARVAAKNAREVEAGIEELDAYLTEGKLTEQHLLDHMKSLLDCLRRCNSALRWRLLHARAANPKWRAAVAAQPDKAVELLLKTSQLEYKLKNMFQALLEVKADKWQFCKQQVVDRMTELSDYFTGDKMLARVKKDENLMKWFASLAQETESLSEDDGHATVVGRKIQNLIAALEEVEQFEQVDTNLQIKAFLQDTREFLTQMVRITNVQGTVVELIETIADLSYAWEILPDYVAILHDRVRRDPATAVLLRATFLKLASILDVPLTRISQCDSPDAASVAQYYSSELVSFVRDVLDVIPRSVFRVLDDIIAIQTHKLAPLPVKFETVYLTDYAQLPERYQLARLTNQVSVFTEGVLAMEQTLLGVIRVDPRRVLHDGLRKELVRQLSFAMHDTLVFPTTVDKKNKDLHGRIAASFVPTLQALAVKVDGYRRSVEYVQDYIDIAGLKLWQEELARVVNLAVEQEANRYLRRKIVADESKYQSAVVPIPLFQESFMGRTLAALLRLTSPNDTTYSPEAGAWYSSTSKVQVCDAVAFQTLERAAGVVGLAGLDRLLGFRIVHEFARLGRDYKVAAKPLVGFFERLRDTLHPTWLPPAGGAEPPAKFYAAASKQLEAIISDLFARSRSIGHCQLLRTSLAHALSLRATMDANGLYQALKTIDLAIVSDVNEHFKNEKPYPVDEPSTLLADLTNLLDASGFSNPLDKIYIATDPLDGLPATLMLVVLSYANKLDFDAKLGTLAKRKPQFPIDGFVLVVGIHTVLKQFHPAYTRAFLEYLAQFVNATVAPLATLGKDNGAAPGSQKKRGPNNASNFNEPPLPLELLNTTWFIRAFCRVANVPEPDVLPPEILALGVARQGPQ